MNLRPKKVVIGMSGGVDSSVAAALLRDASYEVVGVSMNFLSCNNPAERSCCSARDREDARSVCEQLSIEHYVIDLRAQFKEKVIVPFVGSYLKGLTPSPCILCNEEIKFQALLNVAKEVGAKYISTGHYAKVTHENGKSYLLKGDDRVKDQSYFLFRIKQEELSKTIFPLGNLSKSEVRKIASEKNLKTREKVESQEVCFVTNDDYAAFVEDHPSSKVLGPGNFVNLSGTVVGKHKGIHYYTIGQRRGLGFGTGKRQYVISIDPLKNEVVLGSDDDLLCSEMTVGNVHWICDIVGIESIVTVKIRSTHEGEIAQLLKISKDKFLVKFENPVRAVAPGQAAVFYDGNHVLGGGWIE